MEVSVEFIPRLKLPSWLKVRPPSGENYRKIKAILAGENLHTVCEEARCPNMAECWAGGTATFMVMGDACTRGCRFCSVESASRPGPLDSGEPERVAKSLTALNLRYAVITSVNRDDLADQGAGHIAECIRAIKKHNPRMLLEFLIPDFRGDRDCLRRVVEAGADVLSHNVETVPRLSAFVRDSRAFYAQSLRVLEAIHEMSPKTVTKSSLMVGLGETDAEIEQSLKDLRASYVEVVTIGQYLRPTQAGRHLPVVEYVEPARFDAWREKAQELGFLYAACGPFVRSSYKAAELFLEGHLKRRRNSGAVKNSG